MSNNEYNVTTTLTAPTPSGEHEQMGMQWAKDAFGINPDVAEAKATLMVKDNNGNTTFTVVDFDRSRELQLQVTNRTIQSEVYVQLSNSFDKMIDSLSQQPMIGEE